MSKHGKIRETIQARIVNGDYQPNRRLPSQSEMSEEFQVSGRVIAAAIAELRNEGYLWTLPHKGSYARPKSAWALKTRPSGIDARGDGPQPAT